MKIVRAQVPCVRFFPHVDPPIPAKVPVQLAGANIHGRDDGCAVLQQAVGEAAGGGPDIQAGPSSRRDLECLNRRLQLFSAASHERVLTRNIESRFFGNHLPWLVPHGSVDANPPTTDQPLRLFPGRAKFAISLPCPSAGDSSVATISPGALVSEVSVADEADVAGATSVTRSSIAIS